MLGAGCSRLSPSVCVRSVTRPSESGLRPGSCIAKRGPSMTSTPPWRSAVARTSASPRPDPPAASASGAPPEAAGRRLREMRRDPLARIGHREHDGRRGRLDRDANGAAGRAVAVGVVDEVSKRTLERAPVAANERRGRRRRRRRRRRRPPPRARARTGRRARPARRRRPRGRGARRSSRSRLSRSASAWTSASVSGSAPWASRYAAFPRSAVIGFRSSCDASATKRRSASRACSSAASIRFSVSVRRSTSSAPVRPPAGRRSEASPVRSITAAPADSRSSGRKRAAREEQRERERERGREQGAPDDQPARLLERVARRRRSTRRRSPRRRPRARPGRRAARRRRRTSSPRRWASP